MNTDELMQLQFGCARWVTGHYRKPARQVLAELAEWTPPGVLGDRYGGGELLAAFEARIAALLGKEAALFMPSGTMAQQIALRLWSERRGSRFVAFHPTSHLELHEQQGYRLLHGLQGVLLGSSERLLTPADLERVTEPLAALLLELPQREIGGQLPPWDELVALIDAARARGAAVHLDGARLWECAPFYARPYAEIAGLFDTVYVSFYKILGGLAGSALAGPAEFITAARPWLRRHGGNLVQMYPFILSAQKGLDERLPRMAAYHAKAVEIAAALGSLPEITVMPAPPPTNMFHFFVRADAERLDQALLDVIREQGVWLPYPLYPADMPGVQRGEFTAGDATLDIPTADIVALYRDALARASAA